MAKSNRKSKSKPKSKPVTVAGLKRAIGRDMIQKIENSVGVGNRLAFTQSCAYPDGTKVFCSTMVELKGGKIARQVVVEVWDG